MLEQVLRGVKKKMSLLFYRMLQASIKTAAREQNLTHLVETLGRIVPDLSDQYTTVRIETPYQTIKTRTQHAFQIQIALQAISKIEQKSIRIVDVGDSSGTHTLYLKSILKNDPKYMRYDCSFFSVNSDPIAVERIVSRGLQAHCCKAEDLHKFYIKEADFFISFQMLEHLYDPISFLDEISKKSICDYFIVTVPYLRKSRVGLQHIRQGQLRVVGPETTHIFELCPYDWRLIFQHAGWEIIDEIVYLQYPKAHPFVFLKMIWQKFDYEGFYGVILKRSRSWAECYKSI